jgi:exopolysaccharide biosynthesis polyprenyl glycosylphosphotransferase
MIVSHSSRLPRKKIALAFGDALCVAAAMFAAVVLRLGWEPGLAYLQARPYTLLMAWSLFMVAFYVGGLYENDRLMRIGRIVTSAIISVSFAALLITGFFYATLSSETIGRGIFLGYAAFVFVAVTLMRLMFIAATRQGFMAQRCLIIGTNAEAKRVIELVHNHPHAGIRLFGLIHCTTDRDHRVGKFCEGYPILGTLDSLEKFVELYDIDRLIMAAAVEEETVLLRRLRPFRYRGLALIDLISLYEELAYEIPIDLINDEWLFTASMNNSRIHIRRLKRLLDLLVALVGLTTHLPIMGLAALLIKLTSKGPVFYRQERLGRDSQPFTLLKLRTMYADAESQTGPVWSTEDDPRITPVGKWLRKFRTDELPQLINVLRGEMSLVGPRPEREVFIRKLAEKVPFYAERLLVPPGITGWAQVMAPYAASIEDSRRKLQFDLYYIKHMSFFLDVLIFAKTFKTIIFGREKPRTVKAANPKHVPVQTDTVIFEPPAEPEKKSQAV